MKLAIVTSFSAILSRFWLKVILQSDYLEIARQSTFFGHLVFESTNFAERGGEKPKIESEALFFVVFSGLLQGFGFKWSSRRRTNRTRSTSRWLLLC